MLKQVEGGDLEGVAILGDLSDAKDHHPAKFVNAVVDRLAALADALSSAPGELYILFGNHDGPSKDMPYWSFLRHVPGICYATELTTLVGVEDDIVLVPFGEEPRLLDTLKRGKWRTDAWTTILMHTSADNAIVENGTALPNPQMPNRFLPAGFEGKVWSGDIHVPQQLGDIEYVGSPYHTRYGDKFKGRCVIYDTGSSAIDQIHFEGAPQLLTAHLELGNMNQLQHFLEKHARVGDRLKISAKADAAVLSQDWNQFIDDARTGAREMYGVELTGANLEFTAKKEARAAPSARRSDAAIVRTYANQQGFDEETTQAGLEIADAGAKGKP